jgi:hypothetical protein
MMAHPDAALRHSGVVERQMHATYSRLEKCVTLDDVLIDD